MNNDLLTKPKITIELSPILEAYCRWIFEAPSSGPIKITNHHEIGQHIFSNVKPSGSLNVSPRNSNPVTFILPLTEKSKDYLKSNFLKVDAWGRKNNLLH